MREHNLGNSFRQRRMREFLNIVEPILAHKGTVSILDIGGTPHYWKALPGLHNRPGVSITIVNLGADEIEEGNLSVSNGNACHLPYPNNSFDIVHSNSVIEHVGSRYEMEKMATEVRRLAPRYFVQTPNRHFPIEPHYKLPFVHWLPRSLTAKILQLTGRLPRNIEFSDAVQRTKRIQLLSKREVMRLFPDATIWNERVLGLTKSIVAKKV